MKDLKTLLFKEMDKAQDNLNRVKTRRSSKLTITVAQAESDILFGLIEKAGLTEEYFDFVGGITDDHQ